MIKKILMVQEEHFVKDRFGNIYATRVLNEKIFKRYLSVFDELIIFARVSESETVNKELKVNLDSIKFVEIPEFRGPRELLSKMNVIIPLFRRACKEVDIVFLRTPSMISIFLHRFIPKKKYVALEFVGGGNYFIDGETKFVNFVNKLIDKEVKKIAKKGNGILYVTKEALQKDYPQTDKSKLSNNNYFSYGVSDVVLKESDRRKRVYNNQVKEKQFKLISVGFMDSYKKGHLILIEILKQLKDEGFNVSLTLVGDGQKKKEFEDVCAKLGLIGSVEFLGKILDRELLFKQLSEADVFVLPSKVEGLPRVVIEALAVGLPVVASRVNGNCELVQDELLVDTFKPEDYIKKIKKLMLDGTFYQDISDQNYEKSSEFLLERLDPEREKFYVSLSELIRR